MIGVAVTVEGNLLNMPSKITFSVSGVIDKVEACKVECYGGAITDTSSYPYTWVVLIADGLTPGLAESVTS